MDPRLVIILPNEASLGYLKRLLERQDNIPHDHAANHVNTFIAAQTADSLTNVLNKIRQEISNEQAAAAKANPTQSEPVLPAN